MFALVFSLVVLLLLVLIMFIVYIVFILVGQFILGKLLRIFPLAGYQPGASVWRFVLLPVVVEIYTLCPPPSKKSKQKKKKEVVSETRSKLEMSSVHYNG